ncbi:hypothetical protein MNBD_NITROSPINAE04-2232 [hydrothermal vent metagenome]|uniref:NIF system FeS cluster assembly NifU C-terminal domain-containing protein n=1 Tax=hydrothermal vent metagenome TaxID=652676 RepID=A0A3B1CAW5_9ZZZZ
MEVQPFFRNEKRLKNEEKRKPRFSLFQLKKPGKDFFSTLLEINHHTEVAVLEEKVEAVLEEVRPHLLADGGNVELVGVENGVVKLKLLGACGSCPSSTMTLKMGIERVLKERIPEIETVEQVW